MFDSDLPIKSINDDTLNRTLFAKDLAKVMLSCGFEESIVIGMYGKWGSGKTSLINMILESLLSENKSDNLVILKFNPWLCSDSKQLIHQFLKQLSSEIKIKQPSMDRICGFINDYADAFDLVKSIPILGKYLSIIGKILNKKAKLFLKEKDNNLQKIKDSIMSSLKENSIKIIVTIDDIDRLLNEEIIAVFQLIKSIADFPRTVYLVSFDRDIIVKALGKVQQRDGGEYLEKIIQVPFELLTPDSDSIYQIFIDKISSIITVSDKNWDEARLNKMWLYGIKPYMQSIRDVVRLVNTFTLKYALLKDEVYHIDLLGLMCLQVFEPEIYSKLPFHKKYLCGKIKSNNNVEQVEIKKAYDFIVAGIPENRITNINNILYLLFPSLRSISSMLPKKDYKNYGTYHENIALRNGLISHVDYFDRYFSLTLESTAITKQFINDLLFKANEPDLIDGIKKIISSKKIISLLDHINANFESENDIDNYEYRTMLILKCLFFSWHYIIDKDYHDRSTDNYLIFIVGNILKNIDVLKRDKFLDSCFNDSNIDLYVIYNILRHLESQYNHLTERLSNLEKTFIKRIVQEFKSKSLLDSDSALDLILLFEKIDMKESKRYINNMIDSDLSMAKFINSSVVVNIQLKRWYVRKDDIRRYINIEEAYNRISKFIFTDEFRKFSLKQKKNIIAFIIYMEELDKENHYIYLSAIKKKLKDMEEKV